MTRREEQGLPFLGDAAPEGCAAVGGDPHRRALEALHARGVDFLLGGAFALQTHPGVMLRVRIPAESITDSDRSRSAIPACRSRRSEATLGVAYLADFG